MTPPDRWDALIDRYIAGTCTPSEEAELRRWFAESPERARVAEMLRAARARVDAVREEPVTTGPYSAGRLRVHVPMRIGVWAAAACILVALGFAVGGISHRGHASAREYATKAGQRESVTLSDGTRVTLAPGTRVSVPVDYAAGDRAIRLDGEAFFAVVHDATHPFSVRARNAVATDIGTQFDVRAFADDRDVRVAVADGRVGIRHNTLVAGDVAHVDTALAITHGANVASITSWTSGTLAFHDVPLREVLADLARWYDLDIHLTDSTLGGRSVRGTYTDAPPQVVLSAVTSVVGARYEQHGRTVTVLNSSETGR